MKCVLSIRLLGDNFHAWSLVLTRLFPLATVNHLIRNGVVNVVAEERGRVEACAPGGGGKPDEVGDTGESV